MEEKNKQEKKRGLPLPDASRGGLNVLAKYSLSSIIFENCIKVNNKIKFFGKIEGKFIFGKKTIIFNSENLFKHFKDKHFKEFINRRNLFYITFSNFDKLYFESEFIGYFIYKSLVIKVVLGKQSNGNYFVKTYFKDDKYTELYKKYLKNNNNLLKDREN